MKWLLIAIVSPLVVFTAPAEAAWRQHPANPILTATYPWEGHGVHEPTVVRFRGQLLMFYNAGNWQEDKRSGLDCAIGVAVSRDGLRWSKRAGNPIFGQSRGGVSYACHNHVVAHGDRLLLFFVGPGGLRLAESFDGLQWRLRARAILTHAGPWAIGPEPVLTPGQEWTRGPFANTFVWHESRGWRLMYEAWTLENEWATALALGWGLHTWRPAPAPIEALRTGEGGFGGPWIERRGPVYHVYFHASPNGHLPTDIYYRSTKDFVRWGPIVEVVRRDQSWEVDQVADPSIIRRLRDGRGLLYFDGDDNPRQFSAIGLAVEQARG